MKKKAVFLALFASLIAPTWAATEVRLATHDSFSLPKPVLATFEKQYDAKIRIIKMGDGNEMLNRLILTRGKNVLADAVFGLDNASVLRAQAEGVLSADQPKSRDTVVSLPHALPVDYGFVNINYDKEWFAKNQLPLPQSLDDLTKPEYRDLLVMPNPATSTPGFGFLLANIAGLGEENAFAWWAKMRQNGVKITKGWSDAYYTEFSLNGGARPMMVGYSSSPAAEVFYSEGKLSAPRMGNLFLNGGNFLHIEGAAVINGAKEPELAKKLVQFLQSKTAQREIFTTMWVYPAVKNTPHNPAIIHASAPKNHFAPPRESIAKQYKAWTARWVKTVLK